MLLVKIAGQKQFNHCSGFYNVGAKVILDWTPYSDLIFFRKTINEMVSYHSVNTWLDLTTFRKTGGKY